MYVIVKVMDRDRKRSLVGTDNGPPSISLSSISRRDVSLQNISEGSFMSLKSLLIPIDIVQDN